MVEVLLWALVALFERNRKNVDLAVVVKSWLEYLRRGAKLVYVTLHVLSFLNFRFILRIRPTVAPSFQRSDREFLNFNVQPRVQECSRPCQTFREKSLSCPVTLICN